MHTTIIYDIPADYLEGILVQLGYSDTLGVSKELFMNEAIKKVVLPAIANVFINVKQAQIAQISQDMPAEVQESVSKMLSINTI